MGMAPEWTRLNLLYGSAGMAASGFFPIIPAAIAASPAEGEKRDSFRPWLPDTRRVRRPIRRAAIIGDSREGDYGMGLENLFQNIDGLHLIAVADPDETGLRRTAEQTGAPRGYTDYQTMLERERPDLVCVATRSADQHFAMAKAALEAGAHVFIETPFAQTMAEADQLMAIAKKMNLRIAVALQMSCDPRILAFHRKQERLIGDIQEMRVYGKMDDRAGGEDLVTRATHLFDLICLFAGEPSWVTARIWRNGRPARIADIHPSGHGKTGPILGDDIFAHFAMRSGVNATFVTRGSMREISGGWGIDFIGARGCMRLFAGFPPTLSLLRDPDPRSPDRTDTWERWPGGEPYHSLVDGLHGLEAANRLVLKDWLDAIDKDREPLASAARATRALEMIHGVFRAGLTGKRVGLPTFDRSHPLVGEL